MVVFNITETRRDRKNLASDSKSAPQNYPLTVEKSSDACYKYFLVFSLTFLQVDCNYNYFTSINYEEKSNLI